MIILCFQIVINFFLCTYQRSLKFQKIFCRTANHVIGMDFHRLTSVKQLMTLRDVVLFNNVLKLLHNVYLPESR